MSVAKALNCSPTCVAVCGEPSDLVQSGLAQHLSWICCHILVTLISWQYTLYNTAMEYFP